MERKYWAHPVGRFSPHDQRGPYEAREQAIAAAFTKFAKNKPWDEVTSGYGEFSASFDIRWIKRRDFNG